MGFSVENVEGVPKRTQMDLDLRLRDEEAEGTFGEGDYDEPYSEERVTRCAMVRGNGVFELCVDDRGLEVRKFINGTENDENALSVEIVEESESSYMPWTDFEDLKYAMVQRAESESESVSVVRTDAMA